MVSRIRKLVRYIARWWSGRQPATQALVGHVWRALVNFRLHGLRQAAALAYYAIFSIFPLTLLLAVAASSVLGATVAQEQIIGGLAMFVPADAVELLQTNVSQALQQSTSFSLIALLGLIWSALGLFSNISSSLELIFRVTHRRSMWRQRLLAFVMTIILVILVAVSFLTSGILRLVSATLFLNSPSIWVTIATFFLPLGLDMVIFALLFRYVPARHVSWDAIWPAAIFGAISWEVAKTGFGWYLANLANYQFVYGSIAAVIVFLFWAYLSASIFLLSAELCAQLDEWVSVYRDRDTVSLPDYEEEISEIPSKVPPHNL